MFQMLSEVSLIEMPIQVKIEQSDLSPEEKRHFINLLSYFTPDEIDELRSIL